MAKALPREPPAGALPVRAETELVPVRRAPRLAVLDRLFGVADTVAALTAGALAALAAGSAIEDAIGIGGACALVVPVVTYSCGLYAADDLRAWVTGVPDLPRLLFATLVLSWPVSGVAELAAIPNPNRFTALAAVLTFTGAATGRALARVVAHRSEHLRERTAIVGSGLVAGELVQNLRRHREIGLLAAGIVENAEHYRSVDNLPHLGELEELPAILGRHDIDRVIIAFTRAGHVELLQTIRACRDASVPVHIVPRLFEFVEGARALDHIGTMPILSLGVPRLSTTARAAKRALDIFASVTILVLGAPLLALIGVAIKLDSPGHVLFRQARAGRGAKTFELLKFRSMRDGAEAGKPGLLHANEVPGGVMFKIRRDPRITRVGRLLRRFSLDELPQMWNVLRGEMSLVGPRPLVLAETERLAEDWHLRRSELRPGITGPWQVTGRSDVPFDAMVRFDYQYVAGWSLARDLEILCATVPAVLSGRGAY